MHHDALKRGEDRHHGAAGDSAADAGGIGVDLVRENGAIAHLADAQIVDAGSVRDDDRGAGLDGDGLATLERQHFTEPSYGALRSASTIPTAPTTTLVTRPAKEKIKPSAMIIGHAVGGGTLITLLVFS